MAATILMNYEPVPLRGVSVGDHYAILREPAKWIVRSLDLFGTPCNTPYESLEAAIADKAAREASGLHHEVILMPVAVEARKEQQHANIFS